LDQNDEKEFIEKLQVCSSTKSSSDIFLNDLPNDFKILNLEEQLSQEETNIDHRDSIMQKQFIKSISSKNHNKVLIHCSLGVSRSSTFTILYLMKKFSLNYDTVNFF
jgi:protein tyrosine phosphatase